MLVFYLHLKQNHKYWLQNKPMMPFHINVIEKACVEFFMLTMYWALEHLLKIIVCIIDR